MNKYLLIGLGNIGPEYIHTRHNIGFDVIETFVTRHGAGFRVDRLVEIAELKIRGRQVICIKPTTYMNLSGKAVKYWREKEHIALENMLVVVDEVSLPLDRMRLRPTGSAGGHNGLKSIEEILLTDAYPRLRFGIGNDYPRGHQVEYVLGRWKDSEEALIRKKTELAADALESFILNGIDLTMNHFNKLSITL
jgi:peptidyl-tRNA hydrolase, PTH1 family